jgi:hypothetical protein
MSSRIWIFMVDSGNSEDLRDLDHLSGILWGANPNTQKGDIVLMYRTAPYSDIAYIFRALSVPRETRHSDHADANYVIELGEKIRLQHPITLFQIRANRALAQWSFARYQQGVMRRSRDIDEEGFWLPLRDLIISKNKELRPLITQLAPTDGTQSSRIHFSVYPKLGPPNIRVFLSYSSTDRARVRRLYRQLQREEGIEPWLDQENLKAGVDWKYAIENALRLSHAVIICLSSSSVRKIGVLQQEIQLSLEIEDMQPEGTSFIIPVKLERCEIPGRLSRWQYVEMFKSGGYQKLVDGLRESARFLVSA